MPDIILVSGEASRCLIMSDQTESKILGVSARGWLAFIVIYTVCVMSSFGVEVSEPLNTMVHVMIGFYFARSQEK